MTKTNNLDDLINKWHNDPDDQRPLHEVLGMTWEEYSEWVKNGTEDKKEEEKD